MVGRKITPKSILDKYEGVKEPYKVEFFGESWWIFPGVADPTKTYMSQMFAEAVKEMTPEKGVILDMGCGCGVDAILAAEKTEGSIFACDINPWAVMCTKLNDTLHYPPGERIHAKRSNLFENIPEHMGFNAIYFNGPFAFPIKPYDGIETPLGGIEHAIFDEDYEIMKRFLKDAGKHLFPEGFILITASTLSGSDYILKNHAKKNNFGYRTVKEEEREGEIFRVYELRRARE